MLFQPVVLIDCIAIKKYNMRDLLKLKKGKEMARRSKIKIGDIYLDCDNHPVLCTEVDGDDVAGISLIDGSRPRSCSIKHCGVERLKFKRAVELRDVLDLVLPAKLRDIYNHSTKRIEIITFAHECETTVSSGVVDRRGAFESIDDIDKNIVMWAEARGHEFSTNEIYVISGLVLLRLYLIGWLSKGTIMFHYYRDNNKLAV